MHKGYGLLVPFKKGILKAPQFARALNMAGAGLLYVRKEQH